MSDYDSRIIRKYLRFYGSVQGVGFRYRAEHAANHIGVTGWVRNEADGSVAMEIQGTEAQIDKVIMMIEEGSYISIDRIEAKSTMPVEDEYSFRTRGR